MCPRAGDQLRRTTAGRRHAGQALQKVQGGPLTAQDGSRRAANVGYRASTIGCIRALLDQAVDLYAWVDRAENRLDDGQAAHHAWRFLQDLGSCCRLRPNGGFGCQVAAADVLGERQADDGLNVGAGREDGGGDRWG